MEKILNYLLEENWQGILDHCAALNDNDRYEMIEYLKKLDVDKDILKSSGYGLTGEELSNFYAKRYKVVNLHHFALITCTRSYEDIKKTEKVQDTGWVNSPLLYYLSTGDYESLLAFYSLFPPDYLDKVVNEIKKNRFSRIKFKIFWKLYEKGWVSFDEEFFVDSLFRMYGFENNYIEDANFLIKNPLSIKKVFLQFYKYEIPILDRIKSNSIDYSNGLSASAHVYWTEVFKILLKENQIVDRSIIKYLLESLLNHWKKTHLNWHIRLLELLNATPEEYLENQSLLFAILGTGNMSLINFSIDKILKISKLQNFDKIGFMENFALTFSNEKCTKSILSGLQILENILSKPAHKTLDYSEQIAILLSQSDSKLQEKAATLLVKFGNKESLQTIIAPYTAYLKQKTKEILNFSEEIVEENANENTYSYEQYKEVAIPSTWEELLFQVGNCIRTKSALDIDLFLEGLNQLQNQVPNDYVKQLKPYTKQLLNRNWENYVMRYFSTFLREWTNSNEVITHYYNENHKTIPFLRNKCTWLLQKIKDQNSLPFLSTPTHEPFYIHPTTLIERLLQYEKQGREVFLEDLIVACNRLLLSEIDDTSKKLANQLSGFYANALKYYIGITEKIELTEETLPLWAQVTRIKNPNGIYPEFEQTRAKDYSSVVKPFEIGFFMQKYKETYGNLDYLRLNNNWSHTLFDNKKDIQFEPVFYHTGSMYKAARIDITYQLSLNPQYLDAQICRYIPVFATRNEVNGFEDCLFPLQFLLDNKIKIYHSGWIYIATCLLFEKKISRELASEYIQFALLQQDEKLAYLADVTGQLIAQKYAPINRLLEFFDKPISSKKVKEFQHLVLAQCITHFNRQDLPTNAKKIFTYYKEWSEALKVEPNKEIIAKINATKNNGN